MRKLLGILFCALVVAVCGCGGNDYSKEIEYLDRVYYQDKLNNGDSVPKITILRAEKIKAYNPTLDEDAASAHIFYETVVTKTTKAFKLSDDKIVDALVEALQTKHPNSDAMVLEFQFPNKDRHFFNIIYSKDGEYYDNWDHVMKYVIHEELKRANKEFGDRIYDALSGVHN